MILSVYFWNYMRHELTLEIALHEIVYLETAYYNGLVLNEKDISQV